MTENVELHPVDRWALRMVKEKCPTWTDVKIHGVFSLEQGWDEWASEIVSGGIEIFCSFVESDGLNRFRGSFVVPLEEVNLYSLYDEINSVGENK